MNPLLAAIVISLSGAQNKWQSFCERRLITTNPRNAYGMDYEIRREAIQKLIEQKDQGK